MKLSVMKAARSAYAESVVNSILSVHPVTKNLRRVFNCTGKVCPSPCEENQSLPWEKIEVVGIRTEDYEEDCYQMTDETKLRSKAHGIADKIVELCERQQQRVKVQYPKMRNTRFTLCSMQSTLVSATDNLPEDAGLVFYGQCCPDHVLS